MYVQIVKQTAIWVCSVFIIIEVLLRVFDFISPLKTYDDPNVDLLRILKPMFVVRH